MPYFVEGLRDVKNAAEQYCSFSRASFIRTILCVFYCGVPMPEAELMIGY
jgi:hypothetical protein